jgi:hypothetical protein
MSGNVGAAEFVILMCVPLLLAAYFLPTIVAIIRGKRNLLAILLVNLLLGWSIVGWIIAVARGNRMWYVVPRTER